MEGVKAEVNAKIRSAIKAKLMELGVYVDEELPDYIMVMVVNKRTKVQMDDDLQLFLGSNTELFTGWLHQVLQKLEEVTVASLDKKSVKPGPDNVNTGGSKRKTSTGSNEGETHRKEKRRKSADVKKVKKNVTEQEKDTEVKKDSDITGKVSDMEMVEGENKNPKSLIIEPAIVSKPNKEAVVSSSCVDAAKAMKMTSSVVVLQKSPPKKLHETTADSLKKSSVKSAIVVNTKPEEEESVKVQSVVTVNDRTLGTEEHEVTVESKVVPPSEKQTLPSLVIAKITTSILRGANTQPPTKNKIVLMHSDDEDDDEDFINIKADAEAEELLNEELPKESLEPAVITPDPVTSPVVAPVLKPEEKPVSEEVGKVVTVVAPPEPERVEVPTSSFDRKRLSPKDPDNSGRRSDRPETSSIPLSERFTRKRKPERDSEVQEKHGAPSSSVASRVVTPVLSIKDRLGVKKSTSSERHNSIDDRIVEHTDRSRGHSVRVTDRLGQRTVPVEPSKKRRMDTEVSSPERRNTSTQAAHLTVEKALRDRVTRRVAEDASSEEDKDQKKRPPLLSRVVLLRPDREEEYDPANPAVGTVASVVRVKPRPRVPAALQANRNLLLKAMAEAQKSVANAPIRPEPNTSPRRKQPDNVFGRRPREANIAITLPNRRMQLYQDVQERESNPVQMEMSRSRPQKIMIQVSSNELHHSDTELEEITRKVDNTTKVKEADEEAPMEREEAQTIEARMEEEEEEMLPDEGIVTEELENEEEMPATLYPPVGLASRMPRESRPPPQRSESPQFLVTLDGLDPNMFPSQHEAMEDDHSPTKIDEEDEEREEDGQREARNSSTPPPKEKGKSVSPIVFTKRDTSNDTDSNLPKSLDRCKYWPSCRLGTKCTFHHPTVPCKSFPKCQFRDKCLYVHPMCKFDSSCTRRDCPFMHVAANIIAAPLAAGKLRLRAGPRSSQVSTQVCKFFPKCSNAGCRFLHPKPCRYGKYCSKQDCNYLHDELPTADKLKWTSPFRV